MNSIPLWLGDFAEDDREAIDALRSKQVAAILAADAHAYAALCTDDVILLLQGFEPALGRDAFIERETILFQTTRFQSLVQSPIRIERHGPLAVEIGRQTLAVRFPSDTPHFLPHRKYMHLLRKAAEGWRFAALTSNNSE